MSSRHLSRRDVGMESNAQTISLEFYYVVARLKLHERSKKIISDVLAIAVLFSFVCRLCRSKFVLCCLTLLMKK